MNIGDKCLNSGISGKPPPFERIDLVSFAKHAIKYLCCVNRGTAICVSFSLRMQTNYEQ